MFGASLVATYSGCSSSSSPGEASDAGNPNDSSFAPDVGDDTGIVPGMDSSSTSDTSVPPSDAPSGADAPALDAGADAAAVDCTSEANDGGLVNDLQCTGLYADWASKTIDPANLAYTPGYVLWSDGANKARYIYLPPGATIDTSDMDNWTFPIGTKIWKEFRLGTQRIETRLFMKTGPGVLGWQWTTYRWTTDGESRAVRLDTGETMVNGTPYEIPAHGQCLQCHGGRPDMVLGFDAIALGRSDADSGVTLATLTAAHRFTANPPPTVDIPEDTTTKAHAPIGWLHMNCGVPCHNSTPSALAEGTGLWLKVSAAQIIAGNGAVKTSDLDTYKTAVNVTPKMQPFASEGFYRIAPGHPELSLIPTLDKARNDPNIPQMPPIVSHIVDTTDVSAMMAWIQAMPEPPDAGVGEAGIKDAGGD